MSNPFAVLADTGQCSINETETDEYATEQQGFSSIAGDEVLHLSGAFGANFPTSRVQHLSICNGKFLYVTSTNLVCLGDMVELRRSLVEVKTSKSDQVYQPRIQFTVEAPVSHIAFSADATKFYIAAASGGLLVYTTSSAPDGRQELQVPALIDLTANPSDDSLALLTAEGELLMMRDNEINSIGQDISAISWSKKGKQIIAGTKAGALIQYTPSGEVKAELQCVNQDVGQVNSVNWLENNLFSIAYLDTENELKIYLLRRSVAEGKTSLEYTLISNPSLSFGDTSHPPNFHFLQVSKTLVLTGSTSSADIGLISIPHNASLSIDDDMKKATLRFSADRDTEVSLTGLAIESNGDQNEKVVWYTDNDGGCGAWTVQDGADPLFENGSSLEQVPKVPSSSAAPPTSSPFTGSTNQNTASAFSFGAPASGSGTFGQSPFSMANTTSAAAPMFGASGFGGSSNPVNAKKDIPSAFGSTSFGTKSAFGAPSAFGSSAFGSSTGPEAKHFAGFGQGSAFNKSANQGFSGFGSIQNVPKEKPLTQTSTAKISMVDDDSDDGMQEDKLANLDEKEPENKSIDNPFGNSNALQFGSDKTTNIFSKNAFQAQPASASNPTTTSSSNTGSVFGTFEFPQSKAGGFGFGKPATENSTNSQAGPPINSAGIFGGVPSSSAMKEVGFGKSSVFNTPGSTSAFKTLEPSSPFSFTATKDAKLTTPNTDPKSADDTSDVRRQSTSGTVTQSESATTPNELKKEADQAASKIPRPQTSKLTFGFGASSTNSSSSTPFKSGFGFGNASFGFGKPADAPQPAIEEKVVESSPPEEAPLPPDPTGPPPKVDLRAIAGSSPKVAGSDAQKVSSMENRGLLQNNLHVEEAPLPPEPSVARSSQNSSASLPGPKGTDAAKGSFTFQYGAAKNANLSPPLADTVLSTPTKAALPESDADEDSDDVENGEDIPEHSQADFTSFSENDDSYETDEGQEDEGEEESDRSQLSDENKDDYEDEYGASDDRTDNEDNGEAESETDDEDDRAASSAFAPKTPAFATSDARKSSPFSSGPMDSPFGTFGSSSSMPKKSDKSTFDFTAGLKMQPELSKPTASFSFAPPAASKPSSEKLQSVLSVDDKPKSEQLTGTTKGEASRVPESVATKTKETPSSSNESSWTSFDSAAPTPVGVQKPFSFTAIGGPPSFTSASSADTDSANKLKFSFGTPGNGQSAFTPTDKVVSKPSNSAQEVSGTKKESPDSAIKVDERKTVSSQQADATQSSASSSSGLRKDNRERQVIHDQQPKRETESAGLTDLEVVQVISLPPYHNLDNLEPARSSAEQGLARELELVYKDLTSEMAVVGQNLALVSNFLEQSKTTPQCIDNLGEMSDEVATLTRGTNEANERWKAEVTASASLKFSMVTLEAQKVKLQRLLRAQTDTSFAQSIRISSLGPEHAAHQKELRRLLSVVEKDLSEFQSSMTLIKTKLAAHPTATAAAPEITAENINTAISKIMRLAIQRSRDVEDLQKRFVGAQLASPDSSFRSPTADRRRHRKSHSRVDVDGSVDISMSQLSMLDQSFSGLSHSRTNRLGEVGLGREARQAGEKKRGFMKLYREALSKGTPPKTVAST